MGEFMVFIVPFLVKTFATIFTNERLVASVDSRMSVEGGAPIKSFTACIALMWFLSCVNDFMTTQSGCLTETFTADFTHKRSGSCVYGHVPGQVVMGIEHFPTFRTHETFLFDGT